MPRHIYATPRTAFVFCFWGAHNQTALQKDYDDLVGASNQTSLFHDQVQARWNGVWLPEIYSIAPPPLAATLRMNDSSGEIRVRNVPGMKVEMWCSKFGTPFGARTNSNYTHIDTWTPALALMAAIVNGLMWHGKDADEKKNPINMLISRALGEKCLFDRSCVSRAEAILIHTLSSLRLDNQIINIRFARVSCDAASYRQRDWHSRHRVWVETMTPYRERESGADFGFWVTLRSLYFFVFAFVASGGCARCFRYVD